MGRSVFAGCRAAVPGNYQRVSLRLGCRRRLAEGHNFTTPSDLASGFPGGPSKGLPGESGALRRSRMCFDFFFCPKCCCFSCARRVGTWRYKENHEVHPLEESMPNEYLAQKGGDEISWAKKGGIISISVAIIQCIANKKQNTHSWFRSNTQLFGQFERIPAQSQ